MTLTIPTLSPKAVSLITPDNLPLTEQEREGLIWPMTDELRSEAAMCLWEAFLENVTVGSWLAAHRHLVGTVELRIQLAGLLNAMHIGWHVCQSAEEETLSPFDWSFVPWFLLNIVESENGLLTLCENWLDLCRDPNQIIWN